MGTLALGVPQDTLGCGLAFTAAGRETLSDLLVRVRQYEYSVVSAVGLALPCPQGIQWALGTLCWSGAGCPVSVTWLQGGAVEGKLD